MNLQKFIKVGFGMLLSLAILFTAFPAKGEAAAPPVLRIGSHASDVWDVQYRLNEIGINTKVDGIYGWQTRQSVISFQNRHGLVPDGIVGSATRAVLNKYSYSKADVDLLARLVYAEARGESYKGQVAVAAVVVNRVESSKFPNTIRGVIYQPGAFTAVSDGQFWLQPNWNAHQAAIDAIRGWDPSHHAIYYFNPNTATSSWIWSRPQLVRIGNHIFTA